MLKAENRLRKNADINRVYKRGSYGSGGDLLSVKAAPGNGTVARAVVVVSKKVDKRAVVRNRIRRRLLGALAEIWATVPDGYDIVISVHRDLGDLAAAKLQATITEALQRARVIAG
jgi:ribonuclease P protein component